MFKKNLLLLVLSLMSLLVFSGDDKDYDNKDCKLPKILTTELKKEMKSNTVTVVDVNGTYLYGNGHIKGSHDMSANDFEKQLNKNKELFVVVYGCGEQSVADKNPCGKCNASKDLRENCRVEKVSCDKCAEKNDLRSKCLGNLKSTESSDATKKAAEKLKTIGYLSVKCYHPGLEGWVAGGGKLISDDELDKKKFDNKNCKLAKISTINLKKAIKDKTVTLVDVNGTKLYAKGHIAGSHDIGANGFEGRLDRNRKGLVVVYSSGEQCVADKDPCEKCNASQKLRVSCSKEKDSCDLCAKKSDVRSNCIGNISSAESSDATKDAISKLKSLGYFNVKDYCAGLTGWVADGGILASE